MYLYVLFQKEGPMEDWFYQMANPLKIKNLLTYFTSLGRAIFILCFW